MKKSSKTTQTAVSTEKKPFPIVGIGASAGGLEALELFFKNVPPASGLGFVVVQHLDPTHKGMMAELLQRATAMPVVQISDRTLVEPNHVYVIPPNHDLSILHGVLHLLEPAAPRGLRLPIDFFLRSLADDLHELSIGVILSGMGSDGTHGLHAIKEKAGAVFVQEPTSAKFDGMPRSAINAGLADVVAPVEELASKIIAYLQHVPLLAVKHATDQENSTLQNGLEKVILLLRTQTGHDFSLYKKNTIYRRIERRMGLHQLSKIEDYVRFLRQNTQEIDLLFKELLIGVTRFFRDPTVWEQLKSDIIPALLTAHPDGGTLRAWCAGCSTGEEAYSLAISFHEVIEEIQPAAHYTLQIFATDLDKLAVDRARTGVYPANIMTDVSEQRLSRFFVQEDGGYRVSKKIREMVIFAPQNLIMDPPFTKLDLLTCRNLLIYLEPELQQKILPLFHYSLNPDGFLLLGTAETVGKSTDMFAKRPPGKTRFYKRINTRLETDQIEFPLSFAFRRAEAMEQSIHPRQLPSPAPNLQALTESLLLQHYNPAAVLTTNKGDIVYINGKTGKYLEPATGKANLNIFAMAREGLNFVLNEACKRAQRENVVVTLNAVSVGTNGGRQLVDISVEPLSQPESLREMLLIIFKDISTPAVAKAHNKDKLASLQDTHLAAQVLELQRVREELQSTREEMQASQEELKSTNEELQSTNEELQSTNEELTTSKEEMQSMNEELQTVNHEMQAKLDELTLVSDDMNNLLNSTEIATLFLDAELNVRRFTPQTTAIINLIPGDTGRPITDLVNELDYPTLAEDAREVLRSLIFQERQVSARGERWFKVRIMPYRTQDNHIDGVVITFVNITSSKNPENILREALTILQSRFDDQTVELDAVEELVSVLQKAKSVL